MNRRAVAIALAFAALAALACDRPAFVVGEGCEVNSDCAAPLVCVIGYCRRQCVDSRDCGAGLRCLIEASSASGGGCQLDHERACLLTSECVSAGLVCQNETCTTRCATARDCVSGATCMSDGAGGLACYEPAAELCLYASDCPEPMVCGRDQACHFECLGDRDCPFPRHCVASLCELIDAAMSSDASGADAGP